MGASCSLALLYLISIFGPYGCKCMRVCMGCPSRFQGCPGSPCAWHKLPSRAYWLEAIDESREHFPITQEFRDLQIRMFGACCWSVGGTKRAGENIFLQLKIDMVDLMCLVQPQVGHTQQVCLHLQRRRVLVETQKLPLVGFITLWKTVFWSLASLCDHFLWLLIFSCAWMLPS